MQEEPEFVMLRRYANRILDEADAHVHKTAVEGGLQEKLFKPGSAKETFLMLQRTEELYGHLKKGKQDAFERLVKAAREQSVAQSAIGMTMSVHRLATNAAIKAFEELPKEKKEEAARLFKAYAEINAKASCGQLSGEYSTGAERTIELVDKVDPRTLKKAFDIHSEKLDEYKRKLAKTLIAQIRIREQLLFGNTDRLN